MIGKLNHIAIAVPNIKEAAEQYKNIFGAKVSDPVEQPDHGVHEDQLPSRPIKNESKY